MSENRADFGQPGQRRRIESLAAWVFDRVRTHAELGGADIVYFSGENHTLSLRDGEPEVHGKEILRAWS